MSRQSELAELGRVYSTAPLSNRNLIINGAMQVAQRGTSFTPIAINAYSLDRWRSEGYSHDVDVTRQTFTSGQTDVDGFPVNYVTVALNETIGSGEYWGFVQRIEKPQMIKQGAQTFTLSFWVRATTGTISAGTFEYGLKNTRTSNPALTTTWQKVTYTFTHTVDTNNAFETLYLPRLSAGTTSFSVDIAQVQLEVGDTATPFEHRSYGDELQRCQRYTFIVSGAGYTPATDSAYCRYQMFGAGSTVSKWITTLPVPMRATPSLITSNFTSSTVQVYNYTSDATVTFSSVALNESGKNSVQVNVTATSGIALGNAVTWRWNNSPAAYIGFDAEL